MSSFKFDIGDPVMFRYSDHNWTISARFMAPHGPRYWLRRYDPDGGDEWSNQGAEGDLTLDTDAINDGHADMVNHPPHYTSDPSGVECIQVAEHRNFCIGNAMKYLWRCDDKGSAIEDLEKAVWYIQREIERRTRAVKS